MTTESSSCLMWDAEMPLLNNRFFLYDMAKLLLWTGLLCGLLFGGIALAVGGGEALGSLMLVLTLILFGFLFLFVMIALVFFGNVYRVRYLIAQQGVGWESLGRRGKVASRLAIVAGALAGSASTAGAGLLAAASESGLLDWSEVRRIRAYPALGVITIMNSWRVVTRLYCTPQYYPYAIQWLRWGAAQAKWEEIGAAPPAVPTSASSGSFAFELLRRTALVAGTGAFLWYFFYTPPLLVKVERTDFAKEYDRKYGERKYPVMGAMELGREFLRQNTNPGSVENYAQRATSNYLLRATGPQWQELHAKARQPLFFEPSDPAVAALMPQIETVYRKSSRLSSYLPVSSEGPLAFLEFWYLNEPRESKAPPALVFPQRSSSWMWLLGGLAIYLLLPWPRRAVTSLTTDRLSLTTIDLLGALFAAFFFAIPLYAVDHTGQVLGDEFGLSVFCWCIALSGIGILLWSARVLTRPVQA